MVGPFPSQNLWKLLWSSPFIEAVNINSNFNDLKGFIHIFNCLNKSSLMILELCFNIGLISTSQFCIYMLNIIIFLIDYYLID